MPKRLYLSAGGWYRIRLFSGRVVDRTRFDADALAFLTETRARKLYALDDVAAVAPLSPLAVSGKRNDRAAALAAVPSFVSVDDCYLERAKSHAVEPCVPWLHPYSAAARAGAA